jgi:hypothetical protein
MKMWIKSTFEREILSSTPNLQHPGVQDCEKSLNVQQPKKKCLGIIKIPPLHHSRFINKLAFFSLNMKIKIQNTNGYTLVSTLVALSLMLLLMVLVSKTLPLVSGTKVTILKLQAINAAKDQMVHTLETKDFRMLFKAVDHNIDLKQEVRTIFSRIYIKITAIYSKTGKELYTLEAYAEKE